MWRKILWSRTNLPVISGVFSILHEDIRGSVEGSMMSVDSSLKICLCVFVFVE